MSTKKHPKGLGDTIESITEATGIKKLVKWAFGEDCGCSERKTKLNKMFPYKTECLVEQEYKYLQMFFNRSNKNQVTDIEQRELLKIYNRVFNVNKQRTSCGSCLRSTVKELDKLFKEYKSE